jgi:hypothetical protein
MLRRMPDGGQSRSEPEPEPEPTMPADLAELCAHAEARATAHGHILAQWQAPAGEEGVARASACRRCGRSIYVRSEGDLKGLSGRSLTEPCDA